MVDSLQKRQISTSLVILAVVAALGIVGVVGVTMLTTIQKAEAVGCPLRLDTPIEKSRGACFDIPNSPHPPR